ncbi:MAG: NAD(P)-dependent oxidoreductase [Sneathiellaceae bacterium]
MTAGRVLVTGAAGLIGRTLCARLHAAGRPILATDRVAPDEAVPWTFKPADLLDIHRIHALMGEDIDCVFHGGGISGPMLAKDNPASIASINIDGTLNVLEAARLHGVRRVVYCSSLVVYWPAEGATGPLTEAAPFQVNDMYAASKVAGEWLARTYTQNGWADTLSFRIGWVYGPRRSTDCIINTMLTDAMAGRPTLLPHAAHFRRQFVHVDDVVSAVMTGLDMPEPPQRVYNLGAPPTDYLRLFAAVKAAVPGARLEVQEDGPAPADGVVPAMDTSAVERDLGWRPQTVLEEAVKTYAAHLRDHSY